MTSEVFNTDCLEYMRTLPDKAFQLAIADPPYGVSYARGKNGYGVTVDKMNGHSDQFGCEIAWQSFDLRTDIVHYMWLGMFQGEHCDIDIRRALGQQGNKSLNEQRIHPTQKPVALYAWILKHYATEGDRIFDPMMGSQSSRIAAYKLGFDYVGCELDKEYFDKGCERFEKECHGIEILPDGKKVEQLSLF